MAFSRYFGSRNTCMTEPRKISGVRAVGATSRAAPSATHRAAFDG